MTQKTDEKLHPRGQDPKQIDDVLEWAQWYEKADRIVEKTMFGDVMVSTVFLGCDHSHGGTTPILFETMIFGRDDDSYQERYATWDEAVKGHEVACELVKAAVTTPPAKTGEGRREN